MQKRSSSLTISFSLIIVAIGLYPIMLLSTIDPHFSLTVYNAATTEKSLGFLLKITALGTPLILLYTVFVYRKLKRKVIIDESSY